VGKECGKPWNGVQLSQELGTVKVWGKQTPVLDLGFRWNWCVVDQCYTRQLLEALARGTVVDQAHCGWAGVVAAQPVVRWQGNELSSDLHDVVRLASGAR
jgi:hypothetical protein